jgi:hypothetical protein
MENRQHSNLFDSASFPQQSCVDSLPQEKSAYPVEIYTIFIPKYDPRLDDAKLQKLRDKYCQQAVVVTNRTNNSSSVIQVASLRGRDRANKLKEILSHDFQDLEISEPTTINTESLQKSSASNKDSDAARILNTPQKIGTDALLNESQINILLKIDGTQAVRGEHKYPIRVVLPTYIPKGYELVKFEVKKIESRYGGNEYYLGYKNDSNFCFKFRGGFKQAAGGSAELAATVDANSPALGRVPITAVRSEKSSNQFDYVSFFHGFEERNFGEFEFSSPSSGYDKCKTMNFVEAVKVAESFQFLQPDVKN